MHEEARVRLRHARQQAGLTLRELAEMIGVSTSLLSQIERGHTEPSVASLYALSSALDISMDEILNPASPVPRSVQPYPADVAPVVRAGTRPILTMTSGVTWEQLTAGEDPLVDALLVTYRPGSRSAGDGELITHSGTEYAYLIEGELSLTYGFRTLLLRAGDSLAFDSSHPHLYSNESSGIARGVFFVVGRTERSASSSGTRLRNEFR